MEQRWSHVWLQTLQNLDLRPIGSTTTAQSRIRRLEVTKGMVNAEVRDRKHGLCRISILFAPLSNQAWEELQRLLQPQAVGSSQLDPRLLFSEKEATFAQLSPLLLPVADNEIQVSCSCCQTTANCPALQAVYEQVGTMLDEEPVLLLQLRGREWQQLAQALQEHRHRTYTAAVSNTAMSNHGNGGTQSPGAPNRDLSADVAAEEDALDLQLSHYWGSRRAQETFHHHIAPPTVELTILRRLGPLPEILQDPAVDQRLAQIYQHVTREAEALAYDLDRESLADDAESDSLRATESLDGP